MVASLEEFLRGWDPASTWRSATPYTLRWLFVDDAGNGVEFATMGSTATFLVQTQIGAAVDQARPTWGAQTWERLNNAATAASALSGMTYEPPARNVINRSMVRWALALTYHRGRVDRVVLPRSMELPAFNVPMPLPREDPPDPIVARTVYAAAPADAGCFYQTPGPLTLMRSEGTDASTVTIGAGETVEVLGPGTLTRNDLRTYRVRTRGGFVGFAFLRPADLARCPAALVAAPPSPGLPAPPPAPPPAPDGSGTPRVPGAPAGPSTGPGWGTVFAVVGVVGVVGGGIALASARGRRVAG